VDGLDDDLIDMQVQAVKAVAGKVPVFAISSSAHEGLKDVLRALSAEVSKARQSVDAVVADDGDELETISLGDSKLAEGWTVETMESDGQVNFIVRGDKIEKFARRTDFNNFEGVNRLRDIMKKMGIMHELRRQGSDGGSLVNIAGREFTLSE